MFIYFIIIIIENLVIQLGPRKVEIILKFKNKINLIMDENENEEIYFDPIERNRKKRQRYESNFDYITIGIVLIAFCLSWWMLFSWQLDLIHYNLFLTCLWMYMWFVNWIDKYFVRPRRILRRVIRLTYNIGKMVYFKTMQLMSQQMNKTPAREIHKF